MFINDGIAYAGEATPDLRVDEARFAGNLQMSVAFNTGETRLLDAYDSSPCPRSTAL